MGPNGSGKTTLFRLISTLMPVQAGQIEVDGRDVRDAMSVRKRIGIVFQAPSLDVKLTVEENIACQAALYGISGKLFRDRSEQVLAAFGLTPRRRERCEKLSGGLKRRVELAKGILHRPAVMLLDEPSTGLDPTARLDLWEALREMTEQGISVVLTTHLLEEADKADRLAIMAEGRVIAEGAPGELREALGDGLVTVDAVDPAEVMAFAERTWQASVQRVQHQVRIRVADPAACVPKLAERFGADVRSMTVGRPSLEDVFIAKTGHRYDVSVGAEAEE